MLMPVLVYAYGPKEAVPIMAIAAVMANFSRILAWWREVDWRAGAAYSPPPIPGPAPGARARLVRPAHAGGICFRGLLLVAGPAQACVARRHLVPSVLPVL